MKNLTLIALLLLNTFFLHAQPKPIVPLKPVNKAHGGIIPDKAIIYGRFDGRRFFSADWYMILLDTVNGKWYSMQMTTKDTRFDHFCNYIEPGTYVLLCLTRDAPPKNVDILNKVAGEGFFSNISNIDLLEQLKHKPLADIPHKYFTFTVAPNTLDYLGAWDFTESQVKMVNDKEFDDRKFNHALLKYDKLDFDKAVVEIPK